MDHKSEIAVDVFAIAPKRAPIGIFVLENAGDILRKDPTYKNKNDRNFIHPELVYTIYEIFQTDLSTND